MVTGLNRKAATHHADRVRVHNKPTVDTFTGTPAALVATSPTRRARATGVSTLSSTTSRTGKPDAFNRQRPTTVRANTTTLGVHIRPITIDAHAATRRNALHTDPTPMAIDPDNDLKGLMSCSNCL